MENLAAMKKVLTESTGFLYEYLEPEDVLINLKAKGAISNMETAKIRKKDTSPEQVDFLLDILQKKPLTSYMIFMEVLKAARNDLYDRVKELEKKHNWNPDPKSKGADKIAPHPVIKLRDITIKKHLKTGGFGSVSLAVHNTKGEVAIKVFPPETSADDIRNEVKKMWRSITSPYLVHMIGVIEEGSKQIVMEYFENGDLQDFNRKYMMGYDCWARKVKMVLEIALGMNFLHTLEPPVIHRDLKLNNIFVDNGFKVKIGDFGLAINTTSILTQKAADVIGTCSHIPPEIWKEAIAKPDELCDVFSFGITLFELLSGQDPWPTDVIAGAVIGFRLADGKRPDTEAIPLDAPHQIVDIMTNCWDGERNNRPIFQKIQGLVSTIYHDSYKMKIHHADSEIMKKLEPGMEKGHVLERPLQKMAIAGASRQVRSKDATHTTHEPGSWVFESVIQEARMEWPRGIACDGNAGIIVADVMAHNAHVYNEHGVYQRGLDVGKWLDKGETSKPHCVVSTGTTCYLTDNAAYVRVFDSSKGAYKTMWLTVAPSQSVGNKKAELQGIDMDGVGNVMVGCCKEPYYISRLSRQDGSRIHSFNVSIRPFCLAVTPEDTVIISNGGHINGGGRVEVVSMKGDHLHNVQYPHMSYPQGVHCHGNVIYVCDWNRTNISCLSVSGKYLDCITTDTSKYGDGEWKGCNFVWVNREGNKMYVSRGTYSSARVEVYVRK